MHRGCNWRPAGHFDRERYSGAEDEACYHDGHKCDGETKRPKTSTKALWPRRRRAAGALWECDLLGHLVHRVKPTRVVWRRRDCGAAIAQAPIGRAVPRLVSPPACPATSIRGGRIADRRRSALERKRWRRSGMRGDRNHDEQLPSVSFWRFLAVERLHLLASLFCVRSATRSQILELTTIGPGAWHP